MIPLITVQAMRESDAATIAAGTPGRELMRRAGEGIFNSFAWTGHTAIVCGGGNNAGDGYVLALLLHQKGLSATIIHVSDRFSADGEYYYRQCLDVGIPCVQFAEDLDLSPFNTIVDCILGTGFHGELDGMIANAVRAINQSGKTVISVDINSGLNGDSGVAPLCVHSDLTVSIGTQQPGHFLGGAKDVIGKCINIDIGIPTPPPDIFLTEHSDFGSVLPHRAHASHKGTYGYVTIMGGCPCYAGAVKLANLSASALRAGCGVAQLAVPASVSESVSPYLLESTLLPIPCDDEGYMTYAPELLDALLSRQAAIAVGMGWGSSRSNAAILEHLLLHGKTRLIIDADGLNTLAQMDLSLLKATASQVVLTPHLKEFERLSDIPMVKILQDPIGHAKAFAGEYGVCLLLKGTCTVITDGKETLLVNRGTPGMSTAGSGDVLSGILAGLLGSRPVSPLTIACGAYIAGLAGELAEADSNPISMLASDTVSHISPAVTQLIEAAK